MMSFGWRPMLSCYATQDDQMAGNVTSAQQAMEQGVQQSCGASPSWFYWGLALAAAAGLAGKKK